MTSPTPKPAYRIDVVEAARLINDHMPTYGSHLVPLENAEGCILRQTVTAEREQPPYDRVTMDGIAIDSTALAQGLREFKLTGNQAAGEAAMRLPTTDTCIEIMTGAVLPIGADTVIPVERIEFKADRVILEAGYEAHAGTICSHSRVGPRQGPAAAETRCKNSCTGNGYSDGSRQCSGRSRRVAKTRRHFDRG